jgi:Immunoglobulin I-set domain
LLFAAFGALAALTACSDTPADAPAADASPASQPPTVGSKSYPLVVREGSVATFTVIAQGAEPMKYQWRRDGVDIAGASERHYMVSSALLADDTAHYSVRISNEHGSAASEVGQLFVVGTDEPMPWL